MQLSRVCVDECFMSKLETTGATGTQNLVDQSLMATAEDLAQSQRLQLVMPLYWDYLSIRHCDQTTDFFTLSRCGYCICAGRIQSSQHQLHNRKAVFEVPLLARYAAFYVRPEHNK